MRPNGCECDNIPASKAEYVRGVHCPRCTLWRYNPASRAAWEGQPIKAKEPTPVGGPGTELKRLFASLGVTGKPGCGCREVAAEMDRLGVVGVRAGLERLAGILREKAKEKGWMEKTKIALRATIRGIVLNPFDVYGSLIELACRRAEAAK